MTPPDDLAALVADQLHTATIDHASATPNAPPTIHASPRAHGRTARGFSTRSLASRSTRQHFVNRPFFDPDATWHLPFASLVTAGIAALAASGHFTNLPFVSRQGAASVGAVSMAAAAKARIRRIEGAPVESVGAA